MPRQIRALVLCEDVHHQQYRRKRGETTHGHVKNGKEGGEEQTNVESERGETTHDHVINGKTRGKKKSLSRWRAAKRTHGHVINGNAGGKCELLSRGKPSLSKRRQVNEVTNNSTDARSIRQSVRLTHHSPRDKRSQREVEGGRRRKRRVSAKKRSGEKREGGDGE